MSFIEFAERNTCSISLVDFLSSERCILNSKV
jgi:hypothetical protein